MASSGYPSAGSQLLAVGLDGEGQRRSSYAARRSFLGKQAQAQDQAGCVFEPVADEAAAGDADARRSSYAARRSLHPSTSVVPGPGLALDGSGDSQALQTSSDMAQCRMQEGAQVEQDDGQVFEPAQNSPAEPTVHACSAGDAPGVQPTRRSSYASRRSVAHTAPVPRWSVQLVTSEGHVLDPSHTAPAGPAVESGCAGDAPAIHPTRRSSYASRRSVAPAVQIEGSFSAASGPPAGTNADSSSFSARRPSYAGRERRSLAQTEPTMQNSRAPVSKAAGYTLTVPGMPAASLEMGSAESEPSSRRSSYVARRSLRADSQAASALESFEAQPEMSAAFSQETVWEAGASAASSVCDGETTRRVSYAQRRRSAAASATRAGSVGETSNA
eukprot:gb/GFBE01000530.1/.p1 GENE.gb/GFBE01000530.1/~~gb/GFBE01000530.1/.p1  ORF type:complete len:387 (+),score=50.36 gb/GFBE01000530.1/:1-1161(+)